MIIISTTWCAKTPLRFSALGALEPNMSPSWPLVLGLLLCAACVPSQAMSGDRALLQASKPQAATPRNGTHTEKGVIDIVSMLWQGNSGCIPDRATGAMRNWCGQKCGWDFSAGKNRNAWTLDATDSCCRTHDLQLGKTSALTRSACAAHANIISCLRSLPQTVKVVEQECRSNSWWAVWCTKNTCWSGCAWRGVSRTVDSDAKNMRNGFLTLRVSLFC